MNMKWSIRNGKKKSQWHSWWLDENGPHTLIYLNTWSPFGGTAWEGLGGVACWRRFVTGGWALRFQKLMSVSVSFSLPHACRSR